MHLNHCEYMSASLSKAQTRSIRLLCALVMFIQYRAFFLYLIVLTRVERSMEHSRRNGSFRLRESARTELGATSLDKGGFLLDRTLWVSNGASYCVSRVGPGIQHCSVTSASRHCCPIRHFFSTIVRHTKTCTVGTGNEYCIMLRRYLVKRGTRVSIASRPITHCAVRMLVRLCSMDPQHVCTPFDWIFGGRL